MQSKHSVVMLSGRFYPVFGGAEIQCLRLCNALIKSGTYAFVLTPILPNTVSHEIIETVPVYRVGLPLNGFFGSLAYLAAGLFWLFRYRKRYSIIHAHLASSNAVLASIASFLTGKPALVKFAGGRSTGDIATSSATWYGRLKLRFLSRSNLSFVCPTKEIKQEMIANSFGEENIRIIPNGVDTEVFKPPLEAARSNARVKLSLLAGSFVAVFAGRLEPGKGVEHLIDAWKMNKTPGAMLVILGKGSIEKSLQQRAVADSSIRFQGWADDIYEYFASADCFVLPSSGEGLPNSLIEAMSCGLPCIGTDIGGIRELITDKTTGLLIGVGDVPALANALSYIQTNPDHALRMGIAARAFAIQNLSIGHIAEQYEHIYAVLTNSTKQN